MGACNPVVSLCPVTDSRSQSKKLSSPLICIRPVAPVCQALLRHSRERVNYGEERQTALPLGGFQGRFCQGPADAVLLNRLQGLFQVLVQAGGHGAANHLNESVPPFIALGDEIIDGLPDYFQRRVDVGGVFVMVFRQRDRVPDNVILADRLKPETLDADRPAPHLGIPKKESWGEGFVTNLYPTRGIDQEAEHVLLAAVQASPAVFGHLGRGKAGGLVPDGIEQVRVVEPPVAYAVNRAQGLVPREGLNRPAGSRQRFRQYLACRVCGQPVDRILRDFRHPAELGKTPVRQVVRPVAVQSEPQLTVFRGEPELLGRYPPVGGFFHIPFAVFVERIQRTETGVGGSAEQLIVGAR